MTTSGISGSCSAFDGGARPSFFKKMDGDGDGKVTKDEMKTAFEARSEGSKGAGRPPHGDGKSLDDLFAEIDTNSDGAIDEDEDSAFRAKHDAERAANQP